jgi:hypothetical protein
MEPVFCRESLLRDRAIALWNLSKHNINLDFKQANYINALAVSVLPFFEPAEVTLGGSIFFRGWIFMTLGGSFFQIW